MKPVLATIAFAALGLVFGFSWQDIREGRSPAQGIQQLTRTAGDDLPQPTATEVFRFNFARIQKDYFRKVAPSELKYAAMEGLMSSLGDPHTVFMEPKIAEEFNKETTGRNDFQGVGARLSPDQFGAKVMTVFKDGPANKFGLKPGDLIKSVDGKVMEGKPIDEIVSKIKGPKGTKVRLTVMRGSPLQVVELTIPRDTVVAPTADGYILDGENIGYLFVYAFAENTPEQFDNVLDDLDRRGINGLIIDLRSNPGGLLESATQMLSRFVSDKLVVKIKSRQGQESLEKTPSGRRKDLSYPVVILLNEDSASAAEIFSGVLHDYKLATLVGEHTYGKASVQSVFLLMDGSSAKVTIGHYFLPSGNDIGRKVDEEGQYVSGGIKPDVLEPLNLSPNVVIGDPKSDNQLKKAIEVIRSKRGVSLLAPDVRSS